MRHRLYILSLLVFLLTGCAAAPVQIQSQLSAVEAVQGNADAGFAKVTEPREFVFPRDHGPHGEYATEWWYYTGNLDTADNRHFGFQLTFFRFGLSPDAPERPSDWATSNLYMAHFALTDVAGNQFYAFDRFSRAGAGLAGATGDPQFRVWLDDWSAEGGGADGLPMRLRAAEGEVAIDLTLEGGKPVVLQGPGGVSQKSATPGNASYYYSMTRMPTSGTISINGQQFQVTGNSWLDREFGTSALEQGAVGWDWFAIQLDDGRDLMLAQLRRADGSATYAIGTLVAADGTPRYLTPTDFTLDATATWRSPRSNAEYPSGWRIQIPSAQLDLTVTPYIEDQELVLTVTYWEGAARVAGSHSGQAYVELTGYGEQGDVRVR